MAQAIEQFSTKRLSQLFRDPMLRDAFQRAERDSGASYAVAEPRKPVLSGGATERVLETA